jgi:hybrid polyketide synthase/nonribosomal peptide synthetase ACE1
VDEIAAQHPDRLAAKDGDGNQLTYAELLAEVSRIANSLVESGIAPGNRVAVFQQPTTTTISSLLAIQRVGAVYVPLDLRSPIPRLKAVVQDCQPTMILAHKATAKYATPLSNKETKIINASTLSSSTEISLAPNRAVADANAVILYTSGSTGTPKGVMLTHAGIRNVVEGLSTQFSLGDETVLQQSALTFDLSLNQIFVALANAGTLFVVPQAKRGDAVEIAQMVQDERITYTLATPSEYSYWLRFGADSLRAATAWKLAVSLGEELKPRLKDEFRSIQRPDLRLVNTYGPAEITVMSHAAEIFYHQRAAEQEIEIPVGFSLPNYSVYILDQALKPVPLGIPGEIAVGGAGVALGYLNLDGQTQERFVKDSFASAEWAAKGWNRLYRTGDRGRLRADGALLFEGRIEGSTQIKLRGLRIDLAEVEHALLTAGSPALDEAVVTVRGDEEQQQFLVAHVVFSRSAHVQDPEGYVQQLHSQLTLPQYMIPAIIIPLDRMPLTSHNKTDRKAVAAIPLPKDSPGSSTEAGLLTPLETELVRIWEVVLSQDLLHSGTVSPNLSFFQVGGNSLLLIPLQSLIKDTFHATLAMIDFASAHTVSKMARLIETSATSRTIDWEAETAIPSDLPLPTLPANEPVRKRTGTDLNILYTGATGHSGKFILKRLIADPRVSKIFLVAVRTTDEHPTHPRKLAVESDKLIQFPGNLLDERLGLSDHDFAYLAAQTDVILHSAANRSLWDNYQVLRHPSVIATQTLVGLAAPRRIPLHFMSSAAIHLFDKSITTTSAYPETIATAAPPVDGSEGYLASKWAVEELLENAHTAFHIPIYFHRPGPIPPDGTQTVPQDVVFAEFLRVVRELRMHVTRESIKGHIDLIVLDELALALRDQLIASVADPESVARYLHHYSHARVQMGEWKAYMDQHNTTLTVDMVEFEHAVEWVGRAKKIGFPYMLAAQDFDMSGVMSSLPIIQRR